MQAPDDLLYTKEHEWVRVEGKTAIVGITDYAQSSLGDITFVDLPKIGSILQQFKQYATIESVKAASDVYAPVSGKVIGVNGELAAHPEMINQSPYDKGYFVRLEISDEKELSALMKAEEYRKYIKGLS